MPSPLILCVEKTHARLGEWHPAKDLEKAIQMSTTFRRLLPIDMTPVDRTELEAAGIVFQEKAPGYNDQIYAVLPEGWSLIPAGKYMLWTDQVLLDEYGQVRARITHEFGGRAVLFIERPEGV